MLVPIDSAQPQGFPWSVFFGVAGTLAGFALNELSFAWRLRLEDRRRVGQALAELLDIHRQIEAVPALMEILRAKIPAPIPKSAEFQLRAVFRGFMPDVDAVRQRYQAAVTAVAGAFPVLAFELRSKDIITPLMNQLSPLVGDEVGADIFVKLEDHVVNEVRPVLKDLIRETASLHSRKTRNQVDAHLRRKFELPEAFDKFISQVLSQAAKQQVNPHAGDPPIT